MFSPEACCLTFEQLSHITLAFAESHLSDGVQEPAVRVEDDAKGQNQAESEQADDIGNVVHCLGPPVN